MGAEASKRAGFRRILAAIILTVGGTGLCGAAVVDFASTVVVGPVGTAAANGTTLLAALTGISGSASAPMLLKIEPGIYDVGSTPVAMKSWVDLEGSGRGITTIRGSLTGGSTGSGIVVVAADSELRSLSVVNDSSDMADSAAVVVSVGGRVTDVAAVATDSWVLHRAILAWSSSGSSPLPVIRDVTATAVGRALQVFAPGLEADNLEAVGSEAFLLSSGSVSARNSIFKGSITATSLGDVAFVASQLDGALSCEFSDCSCVASHDADFRELTAACVSCSPADWCK
jgi:hypothetical protein